MIDALIHFILILRCSLNIRVLSKHLYVLQKLSLIGSTSFGFAQNTLHDFGNTVLNSEWHCLYQMPPNHC